MIQLSNVLGKYRSFFFVLLMVLILIGFGFRIFKPASDPPQWQYIYITDEGHYSYNALNRLRYGDWALEEAPYALVTPLFTASQFLVASLLKGLPDIVRCRSISIISGILASLLLAFFFEGKWIRVIAVLLGSFSFLGIVYSRLGITEMMLALFLQLTVLSALHAFRKKNALFSFTAGLLATGCFMIKLTGAFIIPVILLAPFFCGIPYLKLKSYWKGLITGLIAGGTIWLIFIGIPYWEEWRYMVKAVTSFGSQSISWNLQGLFKSFLKLLLSPALQTMPLLWPLAISWCLFSFLPRVKNKENSFLDILLFLWLVFGVGVLGIAMYQPARWQLIILPPVIVIGLKFLASNPRLFVMIISFVFIATLSSSYSIFISHRFLKITGPFDPTYGIFSHIVPACGAILIFFIVYFALKKATGHRWQAILCSVITLELIIQCLFHFAVTVPSFSRVSQWTTISFDMKELKAKKSVISGKIVENLALYSDIPVLPIFYFLENNYDSSIANFYLRQKRLPTHFILPGFERKTWRIKAPRFMNSLQEEKKYFLHIGGIGFQEFYLYRIKSFAWLGKERVIEKRDFQ